MKLLRTIPFATAAALLALGACSSDSTSGGTTAADAAPGTDSSSADSGTGSDTSSSIDSSNDTSPVMCTAFPDSGAACNTIVNGGTDQAIVPIATAIPVGTGGTIANGRYYLTAFNTYQGSALTGVTLRQTLEICDKGGVFVDDQPSKPTAHKNFTFAPVGTAPNVTTTCSTEVPDSNIPYSSYTASPTQMTFYSSSIAFSVTYTKQ